MNIMEYTTAEEWKTSVRGYVEEDYGDANIYSLIRLTWIEVSRVLRAALSLVLVLFSVVQVAARLTEYLLDVIIEITTKPIARPQKTRIVTTALVTVLLIGWLYFEFLVRPVYKMVEVSTTFVTKTLSVDLFTNLK